MCCNGNMTEKEEKIASLCKQCKFHKKTKTKETSQQWIQCVDVEETHNVYC